MLTAERRQVILDALHNEGRVVSAELGPRFGVSHDTINRDLQELAAEGLLQRVHGGALPPRDAPVVFADRERTTPVAKRALARAAARTLKNGQVILLDSGTQIRQVAAEIPGDLEATIITGNVAAALDLARRPAIELHVLGGRVRADALATVGVSVVDAIRALRADVCLLASCGVYGINALNADEVPVKQAMIGASGEVIAVVTAAKLGTSAPYVVAPIGELTQLITETSADDKLLRPYEDAGVVVTCVKS